MCTGLRHAPRPRYWVAPGDGPAATHAAACTQEMPDSAGPAMAAGAVQLDPLNVSVRPLESTARQNVVVWQDSAVTDAVVSANVVNADHVDPLYTIDTGLDPFVPTPTQKDADTHEMWVTSSANSIVVDHVEPLKTAPSYVKFMGSS